MKMHTDEVDIDAALVQRLLAAQFPHWADLPLARVPSAGTDNALFRLGAEMVVRLPRTPSAVAQVEKEQRWLPHLAGHLPLAIPTPLGQGEPGAGYPFAWSIYAWLPGANPDPAQMGDSEQAARDLAGFIRAMQAIDPAAGPSAGKHNFGRGLPLAQRDAAVRAAIIALGDPALGVQFDAPRVTALWERTLAAPVWDRAPLWLHGDLLPGNLLSVDGRLTAVIDFGGLGVGDPACDLLPAWTFLHGRARQAFRAALGVDDATWLRGGGWALSFALIALPYYLETNPGMVALAWRTLDAVLNDAALDDAALNA